MSRSKKLDYSLRKKALKRCGFDSYAEYLASDLWSSIRERVLGRDRRVCQFCGDPATHVHHASYGDVTLRGERLDKLFACCKGCHFSVEFDGKGKKRRLFSDVLRKTRQRKHKAAERLGRKLLYEDPRLPAMSLSDRVSAGQAVRAFLESKQ